jgi:hypothetical protein
MSGFRWMIEASAGPTREGTIGGRAKLMVRVRLFDAPRDGDPQTSQPVQPDAFTDLRADAARDLAFELLAAAEHAEMLSNHADDKRGRR